MVLVSRQASKGSCVPCILTDRQTDKVGVYMIDIFVYLCCLATG